MGPTQKRRPARASHAARTNQKRRPVRLQRNRSGGPLKCDKLSSHRSAISSDGSDTKVAARSSATNFRPTEVQFQAMGPTQKAAACSSATNFLMDDESLVALRILRMLTWLRTAVRQVRTSRGRKFSRTSNPADVDLASHSGSPSRFGAA